MACCKFGCGVVSILQWKFLLRLWSATKISKSDILWQWQICYLIAFSCWCSNQILSLEGTETSYPRGCRWVPVCSCSWDGKSDLRIGFCDSCAEPAAVWMVWQHFVRTGSSRWRGKAARATMYIRKLYDRSDMSAGWFSVVWIPAEFFCIQKAWFKNLVKMKCSKIKLPARAVI